MILEGLSILAVPKRVHSSAGRAGNFEVVVGVAGFEPANSCSQGKRVRPDFPTPRYSRAWAGGKGARRNFQLAVVEHRKHAALTFVGSHETIKPQHLEVGQPGRPGSLSTSAISTAYLFRVGGPRWEKAQDVGVEIGYGKLPCVFNRVVIIPVLRSRNGKGLLGVREFHPLPEAFAFSRLLPIKRFDALEHKLTSQRETCQWVKKGRTIQNIRKSRRSGRCCKS